MAFLGELLSSTTEQRKASDANSVNDYRIKAIDIHDDPPGADDSFDENYSPDQCLICGRWVWNATKIDGMYACTYLVLHETFHATEIMPGLFLGGETNAADLAELRANNVTAILNCCNEPDAVSESDGFTIMRLDWNDVPEQDILPKMDDALDFVKASLEGDGGSVLVHCVQGISRSGSVVVTHVARELDMSYDEALEFVKAKRPIVRPNSGFQSQIREFLGEA